MGDPCEKKMENHSGHLSGGSGGRLYGMGNLEAFAGGGSGGAAGYHQHHFQGSWKACAVARKSKSCSKVPAQHLVQKPAVFLRE